MPIRGFKESGSYSAKVKYRLSEIKFHNKKGGDNKIVFSDWWYYCNLVPESL